MMGPDASSCLDLDECTIDPEVNLISLHLSIMLCCLTGVWPRKMPKHLGLIQMHL